MINTRITLRIVKNKEIIIERMDGIDDYIALNNILTIWWGHSYTD